MTDIRAWPEAQARVPPIAESDREALRASIERDGVMTPVVVMADGRIIDGHNRWELSGGDCPFDRLDISEEDGLRLALVLNLCRRHMSADQKKEARRYFEENPDAFRRVVEEMTKEGKTQAEIAKKTGYSQQRVSQVSPGTCSITSASNAAKQRSKRAKIPLEDEGAIRERRANGESLTGIAKSYGCKDASAVKQFLERADIRESNPDRPDPRRLFTDEQELEILAHRKAGMAVTSIAHLFDCRPETIRNALRRARASGVTPPELSKPPSNVIPIGKAASRRTEVPPKPKIDLAFAERELIRMAGDVTRKVEILQSFAQHGEALTEAMAKSAGRGVLVEELDRCADVLRTVATIIGRGTPNEETRRYGSATH